MLYSRTHIILFAFNAYLSDIVVKGVHIRMLFMYSTVRAYHSSEIVLLRISQHRLLQHIIKHWYNLPEQAPVLIYLLESASVKLDLPAIFLNRRQIVVDLTQLGAAHIVALHLYRLQIPDGTQPLAVTQLMPVTISAVFTSGHGSVLSV